MFIAALLRITKTRRQLPINRRMERWAGLLGHEKEQVPAHATQ